MNFDNHALNHNFIEEVVNKTIEIENSYDDSMFSRFARKFIEQYATQRSYDILGFFENIFLNQKNVSQSYGDADVTVTKTEIKNILENEDYSALQFIVHCSDLNFFLLKETKDLGHFLKINFYVYFCNSKVKKSINLEQIKEEKNFCFQVNFHLEKDGEISVTKEIDFYDFNKNSFQNFLRVYREVRSISKYGLTEN